MKKFQAPNMFFSYFTDRIMRTATVCSSLIGCSQEGDSRAKNVEERQEMLSWTWRRRVASRSHLSPFRPVLLPKHMSYWQHQKPSGTFCPLFCHVIFLHLYSLIHPMLSFQYSWKCSFYLYFFIYSDAMVTEVIWLRSHKLFWFKNTCSTTFLF